MSVTLLVRSTDAKDPPSLTFDADRIVIGRGAGCDMRLPDPSVSHRHATLRRRKADFCVVDEGSTNGTFVGAERLAKGEPRAVKTGDLVRVGRVWLEVKIDQSPPTHDLSIATRDLALALVSQGMTSLGEEALPKVRVVEGPDTGAVIALAEEGRPYVLGRGESCDLPLADADASREHVQIVRRGGTVLVRDRQSKNGALLGEARVASNRDVPWKTNVLLCIGKTLLALDEPSAIALADLEQADDEPIKDGEVEPQPTPLSTSKPPGSVAAEPKTRAPIAALPSADEPEPSKDGRWTATDIVVVFAAIAILALSLAGLVWLLKS